jgi:general stress protein YciG
MHDRRTGGVPPRRQGTFKEIDKEIDMAENRNQTPKPESASKRDKRSYEQRERERASQVDQSHQDNARGDRNPGNSQNDRERASEAGRKGGQR